MGNSTLKEAHGRTLFRNREVFPARNKSRREVEGVSGTESEDRDDVEHYRELRRGCGEGGGSRSSDCQCFSTWIGTAPTSKVGAYTTLARRRLLRRGKALDRAGGRLVDVGED